jgi:SAM-dependent methyltransferase
MRLPASHFDLYALGVSSQGTKHRVDQRDYQAAPERIPEAGDLKIDIELVGKGRGQPQQHSIDHRGKQTKGQNNQRAGEQEQQRAQQHIEQAKNHGYHADLPARAAKGNTRNKLHSGKNRQAADQPAQKQPLPIDQTPEWRWVWWCVHAKTYVTLLRMTETFAPIFRTVEQNAQADGKAAYFRLHRYRYAALLAALKPVPAGSHILEVGVTPGQCTQLLVESGYHVSGVDLNPANRKALWDRLGVEVRQANLEREPIPFEDNTFEAIVFSEVIEHLVYSPLPVLREFRRVLRPGGRAVISTPNELYAKSRLRTLLRVLLWRSLSTTAEFRHQMQLEGEARYTTHSRTYTMGELSWLVQTAGFRLAEQRFVAAWEKVGLGARDCQTSLLWPDHFVARHPFDVTGGGGKVGAGLL